MLRPVLVSATVAALGNAMSIPAPIRSGLVPAVALALAMFAPALPATAQIPGAAQAGAPIPDPIELNKLVWSTMAAVDHANRSGNYSVLRDLSAPGFQANNDAAKLTGVFAGLRTQNIDLSNTLLLAPTYRTAPAIVGPGLMRLTGRFGLRPIAINFDLIYQFTAGRWKMYGVAIEPAGIATEQPAPARPATTTPPPKKR